MTVIKEMRLDLNAKSDLPQIINVKQGDNLTTKLQIDLYLDNETFEPPSGTAVGRWK